MTKRWFSAFFVLWAAVAVSGCGDDGSDSDVDAGDAGDAVDASTAVDTALGDGNPGAEIYRQDFEGGDGAWPAPWTAAGGVASADVVSGRARLVPQVSNYSLARMVLSDDESEVEATFTVTFDDLANQGLGFYVRQNGGYLQQTSPTGQGYAVFIEGFRARPGIGVWREIDGVEQELVVASDPVANMASGVTYQVRFVVTQENAGETRLQCKIWPATGSEPADWAVDHLDNTGILQGIGGSFAVDAWNTLTPGSPGDPVPADLFFDDLVIRRIGN